MDIYSPHVLISITFAIFEYLDTALAIENKILRFSRAILPKKNKKLKYKSSLNFVFLWLHKLKESSIKKEGLAARIFSG